eukprot:m.642861 g.642861  ORF g.642861 m.642861 type:complete len:431 (-) comp58346_c0_seq35:212-1504(-)
MLVKVVFVGCVGMPPDEVALTSHDCIDTIKFLRKPWRNQSFYRFGIPPEAHLAINAEAGTLRMVARSYPKPGSDETPVNFAFDMKFADIGAVDAHKTDVSFIVRNTNEIPDKQTLHTCYVCQCETGDIASEITFFLRGEIAKLTEKQVREEPAVSSPPSVIAAPQPLASRPEQKTADSEAADSVATSQAGSGLEAAIQQHSSKWFRGRVSRRESMDLLQVPSARPGDFYVRESRSTPHTYTLSVLCRSRDGETTDVRHFHIEKREQLWYAEGMQEIGFASINELVSFYYQTGMGQGVRLYRIAGTSCVPISTAVYQRLRFESELSDPEGSDSPTELGMRQLSTVHEEELDEEDSAPSPPPRVSTPTPMSPYSASRKAFVVWAAKQDELESKRPASPVTRPSRDMPPRKSLLNPATALPAGTAISDEEAFH